MIELLRNCAHGSEVAVWRVGDATPRFVKVAITSDGRQALDNEIAGWAWYRSVRRPDQAAFCRTLRRDRHVVRIEVEALAGTQGRAGFPAPVPEAGLAEATANAPFPAPVRAFGIGLTSIRGKLYSSAYWRVPRTSFGRSPLRAAEDSSLEAAEIHPVWLGFLGVSRCSGSRAGRARRPCR